MRFGIMHIVTTFFFFWVGGGETLLGLLLSAT
jgi:hypothetical protein